MGTLPLKKVVNADAGDSDHVGGNDWDDLADFLNDVDKGTAKINSNFELRSGKLQLRDSDNSHEIIHTVSDIGADCTANWPAFTGTIDVLMRTLAQTVTNKTFDSSDIIPYITQKLVLSGDISPSQITSDQNDYNPTGLSTAARIRLSADSSFRTITGLQGGEDGRILILTNISVNTILLKDNEAASSAANRFDFGLGDRWDLPLFGGQSVALQYDSSDTKWHLFNNLQLPIIPSRTQGFYNATDCAGVTATDNFYVVTAASGGTATDITSLAGHPGLLQFTLGTSTTGSGSFRQGNATILLGNSWYWRFDAIFKVEALSDGTNTYTLRVGFIDSGSAESTDGVFLRYTHSFNSGNWVAVARSNGTETTANSTTAVSTSNYIRVTIVVNPAGNSARFYVNGAEIVTAIATNIPTGAGRVTGNGIMFLKSAGTANNTVLTIDAQEAIAYSNIYRSA